MVGKQKSSTRALCIHNWQVLSAVFGHRYRLFSLSRNKEINWKPSSGRSQENEML